MSEIKILVVEDEPAIATLIQFNLTQAGFQVQIVNSVEQALPLIQRELPTILLLDWMRYF